MSDPTTDDLFLARTQLDGRAVELVLRLASFDELAGFLRGRPKTAERERQVLSSRLMREVATFDGQPMTLPLVERLLGQPRLLGDVIGARNRLHDEARQRGRLFALCPGCKVGEAELSFMYLMLRLRVSPPPLTTDDNIWLPPPRIAEPAARGKRRGDLPTAAQVRFELPSHRLGLGARERATGGVLRVLDETAERAAWQRFWPEGSRTPADRPWWFSESAPFRAAVRLSAAVERLDRGAAPSPATLAAWPAVDVEYLELAAIAALFTDEPPEERPVPGLVPRKRNWPVDCARCQTRYLPLL